MRDAETLNIDLPFDFWLDAGTAESDEMVEAIRSNDGIVEYVLFGDEGHGFSKTPNRIQGWNAILAFADKYLMGTGT